jgi:fibronectin-binding autotransporter adhesin
MSWMRACRASVGVRVAMAALVMLATMSPVQADPPPVAPNNTSWTGASGSGGIGSWGVAGNWLTDVATQEVPTATLDAVLPGGPTNQTINLGSGAQAKSLFPQASGYTLQNGDLTFADNLWLNEPSGTTSLRLSSNGSNGTVSVSGPRVTIGADAASVRNTLSLQTLTGGTASLTATDKITIGYDGNFNSLTINSSGTSAPATNPGGAATITAPTIQMSAAATAGSATDGWNWLGTYSSDAIVNASNVVIGVAGNQGGAENYGGTWNVANTTLGEQATSAYNYLTVAGNGTYTNSGAFAVGLSGNNNTVFVGDWDLVSAKNGTLTLTGTSDVVIGANAGAHDNAIYVVAGSTFSSPNNIIVGQSGSSNEFGVFNGSTATSGGVRIGVDAGATLNAAGAVSGGSWTIAGAVRVGDAGSTNTFVIAGGTATLTEPGKNFYVGYNKSASQNILFLDGPTAKLEVKATGADVVISANAAGSGANATGNVAVVLGGATIDATRVLVGDGGSLVGMAGTITGNVLVGSGGVIAPGFLSNVAIGSLAIGGNLDLSQQGGGRIDIDLAGNQADTITVGGILDTTNATLHFDVGAGVVHGNYVIASYGSLVGSFATIEGLPAAWSIDFNYLGLNQIVVTAVPEIDPSSFGSAVALAIGALALVERRAYRSRRHPDIA